MEIEITRKFEKQTNACKQSRIRKRVADAIESVAKAEKLSDVKNIKKLKGSEKQLSHKSKRLQDWSRPHQ